MIVLNLCRYTLVLADNVDGGDHLDLIVTTMNGNVFCFLTPSPHHPLKVWHFQMLLSLIWPVYLFIIHSHVSTCYHISRVFYENKILEYYTSWLLTLELLPSL